MSQENFVIRQPFTATFIFEDDGKWFEFDDDEVLRFPLEGSLAREFATFLTRTGRVPELLANYETLRHCFTWTLRTKYGRDHADITFDATEDVNHGP